MKKTSRPIDGFVAREPRRPLGDTHRAALSRPGESNRRQVGSSSQPISTQPQQPTETPAPNRRISRSEIDSSLSQIDDEPEKPKRRGIFRFRKPKKPISRRKKLIKRAIKILIILALIVAAYVGIRAFIAGSNVFQGNIFDIIQSKPLKMDENGRTNILVFGTSGSIDDESHPGANLTDSILVLSVDQNKKNAYTFSIPRDLWVDMNGACSAGFQAKINAMYECHSENGKNEAGGASVLQKKVGEITGLDLQYYAHVNWSVLIGAVDAVGGINVDVQGSGAVPYGVKPGSVLDRNFDAPCNYQCFNVKYEPGVHKMDGIHALAFSRSRNANGGYGFARGNFDREMNQQKVLKALQKKAVSAGTLTNIGKVTALIDTLGENLKTNFATSEIRTLMNIAKDIPSDKITSISFVAEGNELLTTGNVSGQSIVQPVAGLFDYSQLNAFVKKSLNANAVTREAAHVAVFNGSDMTGYAQTRADALTGLGFTVTAVDNVPDGTYGRVEIYDLTNTKSATKAKLEQIYGVTAKAGTPPVQVSADTDIIVIYGPTSAN